MIYSLMALTLLLTLTLINNIVYNKNKSLVPQEGIEPSTHSLAYHIIFL